MRRELYKMTYMRANKKMYSSFPKKTGNKAIDSYITKQFISKSVIDECVRPLNDSSKNMAKAIVRDIEKGLRK